MGSDTRVDLYTPFQILREIRICQADFKLPLAILPRQFIQGEIRLNSGETRCTLLYGKMENHGGYGKIILANRQARIKGAAQGSCCVKLPYDTAYSLVPEAILQHIASERLVQAGIHGAIPRVHDIFQYAGETRFSMDFIDGTSSVQLLLESPTPDLVLLQILAQVTLLLGFLEEQVRLDHRDLKVDNLWIRSRPIEYRLQVGGEAWHVVAPFQVVLLDFGFSCLGNADGQAAVSLSDGILPLIDPCPKEGRDLFQLIASIWSIPQIRTRIGAAIQADIELLLSYKDKSYTKLVKQTTQSHWIYLAVSEAAFRHPPLHPLSLLRAMSIKYDCVKRSSE